MRANAVRAACFADEVSFGSWVSLTDPLAAQIMAHSGFAWLVIDMEHGPVALDALPAIVNAIRTTDVEPLVRAAWNTPSDIQPVLDSGASGIMVPMVSSAADAQRAVCDVRFSPLGARSRGGRARRARIRHDTGRVLCAFERRSAAHRSDRDGRLDR